MTRFHLLIIITSFLLASCTTPGQLAAKKQIAKENEKYLCQIVSKNVFDSLKKEFKQVDFSDLCEVVKKRTSSDKTFVIARYAPGGETSWVFNQLILLVLNEKNSQWTAYYWQTYYYRNNPAYHTTKTITSTDFFEPDFLKFLDFKEPYEFYERGFDLSTVSATVSHNKKISTMLSYGADYDNYRIPAVLFIAKLHKLFYVLNPNNQ